MRSVRSHSHNADERITRSFIDLHLRRMNRLKDKHEYARVHTYAHEEVHFTHLFHPLERSSVLHQQT